MKNSMRIAKYQPTFKLSPICVMVWGCVMKGRKRPLVVLEYPGGKGGGMNTARYQEQALEGVLKEFYEQMDNERMGLFFSKKVQRATKASQRRDGWTLTRSHSYSTQKTPTEPIIWIIQQNFRKIY